MNPSGSFLVEKCFTASNFSHKEAIVAELLAVQSELSKTRHGFHLLKKLDVERQVIFPLSANALCQIIYSIVQFIKKLFSPLPMLTDLLPFLSQIC
jgi:hypothetical protein